MVVSTLMEAWEVVNAGLVEDGTVNDVSKIAHDTFLKSPKISRDSVWSANRRQQSCGPL